MRSKVLLGNHYFGLSRRIIFGVFIIGQLLLTMSTVIYGIKFSCLRAIGETQISVILVNPHCLW